VVGRRTDGYHLLQTVFRFLDFSDRLRFAVREDGVIKLHTPIPGVPEDKDLCIRAAKLLQQESATPRGVEIFLEKRIPMGGGLGGGCCHLLFVVRSPGLQGRSKSRVFTIV
jgi:4-diphosphocytidyl-2-C-methyl-D-erythritol kinase